MEIDREELQTGLSYLDAKNLGQDLAIYGRRVVLPPSAGEYHVGCQVYLPAKGRIYLGNKEKKTH